MLKAPTATQMISNESHRIEYEKWLESPMTQMVLSIVRDEVIRGLFSVPANTITDSSAEMILGNQQGAQWSLDRMIRLSNDNANENMNTDLEADYGSEQILKDSGYTIDEKDTEND